ncbi:lipopolysaccharide biosynthesis protein [Spirosoma rigui]|uniref:lipopolysaccharide biosynthesis protein n=1 Tax=Spirosoma rigui TaxID=564064 RepID=UPI0009AF9CDD|nr:oligosaccharide flippase family protein [Spirosoma rigui]
MESLTLSLKQQFVRHKSRIDLLYRYVTGQGLVQIFNVVTGFLLLRWLTIDDQAKYTFAFSLQAAMSVLADLGFSGSIIALVGSQIYDKERVGNYIAAARYFRRRFLLISFILGGFSIPFLTQQQAWDWQTKFLLLVPILCTIYLQGAVSYYAAPIQIHRQLKAFYTIQVVQALIRLVLCSLLYTTGYLTVYGALWLYNASLLWTGLAYRRTASAFQIQPKVIDRAIKADMLAYLKPMIPSLVFNAFYGQITVFLITYYGKQSSVAELGALTRLGQLFALLNTFNAVVIAPFIARLSVAQLLRAYIRILIGALSIASLITALVWIYPNGFLWLLGSKYTQLDRELKLFVLNQSLLYIGSVLWSMHAARKWIFGFNSWIYIIGLVLIQLFIVRRYNLSTVYDVIRASLLSTGFILLLHIETGLIGWFVKGKHAVSSKLDPTL